MPISDKYADERAIYVFAETDFGEVITLAEPVATRDWFEASISLYRKNTWPSNEGRVLVDWRQVNLQEPVKARHYAHASSTRLEEDALFGRRVLLRHLQSANASFRLPAL